MWRSGLHPVVSVPSDPLAVAEITAALIRADARRGESVRLASSALYRDDPSRGPNLLRSPAETNAAGGGQCFDLTRASGGFLGTHIGCLRSPGGFHVFQAFATQNGPLVYDEAKRRGMLGDPDYTGAAYVPIWQDPPGTSGPEGHDSPPAQDLSVPDEVIAIAQSLPDLSRVGLEAAYAAESPGIRAEIIAALLLSLRSLTEPMAKRIVREQIEGPMTRCSALLLGALSALSGVPWQSIADNASASRLATVAPSSMMMPIVIRAQPQAACPGSCSLSRR